MFFNFRSFVFSWSAYANYLLVVFHCYKQVIITLHFLFCCIVVLQPLTNAVHKVSFLIIFLCVLVKLVTGPVQQNVDAVLNKLSWKVIIAGFYSVAKRQQILSSFWQIDSCLMIGFPLSSKSGWSCAKPSILLIPCKLPMLSASDLGSVTALIMHIGGGYSSGHALLTVLGTLHCLQLRWWRHAVACNVCF